MDGYREVEFDVSGILIIKEPLTDYFFNLINPKHSFSLLQNT